MIKFEAKSTVIWLVGVSFLLFQFFLQLSSGIIIGSIMAEEHLSALSAGLLSSSFYYVYTSLQIPVGLLFDRYNTRYLLAINALICSFGCFIFASGHSLLVLFLGRLIIGGGSAFAFVGVAHLLRQHFPLRQYAFMVGLSETLGFTVAVFGIIGMGTFVHHFGWRIFLDYAGGLCFSISFLLWKYIPDNKPIMVNTKDWYKQLLLIFKSKLVWINGLFVCLEFTVITVFASLWAVPFLRLKLEANLKITSIITSMLLIGAGLSCPLLGYLSTHWPKRKPIMYGSCFITAALIVCLLYIPSTSLLLNGFLMFAIGVSCGAYMLSYSISNELAPPEALSTCTGFTNTLAVLSAPLAQPFIGYLLDVVSGHSGHYTLANYQTVLLIIPLFLIIAASLTRFLPEK